MVTAQVQLFTVTDVHICISLRLHTVNTVCLSTDVMVLFLEASLDDPWLKSSCARWAWGCCACCQPLTGLTDRRPAWLGVKCWFFDYREHNVLKGQGSCRKVELRKIRWIKFIRSKLRHQRGWRINLWQKCYRSSAVEKCCIAATRNNN